MMYNRAMADRVRLRHTSITLVVSILLVGAIGALIYEKNREVSDSARAQMLADPAYANVQLRQMMERSFADQDRRVLFGTIGMLLLLAVWLGLATMITTRELAAQLRRLRQAIREATGMGATETLLERESSVTRLLEAIHQQAHKLRDNPWSPTPSMVFRVESAGQTRFLQTGFVWRWAFLSFAVIAASQVVPVLAWRLQTWRDVAVGAAGWFAGGLVVAVVSPGRTVLEPAVGALFAAQVTLVYLLFNATMQGGFVTEYLLGTVAGFLLALLGALSGEGLQALVRGKPKAGGRAKAGPA